MKSQSSPSSVQRFLDLANQVSCAPDAEQFYETLRAGYLYVHSRLTNDPQGLEAQALRNAFEATQANLAQRLALQLCAMPLYEKPVLPLADDALPEFLWLFTVPVVIHFSQKFTNQGQLVWREDALPAPELSGVLNEGRRFEPRAQLGLFSHLYTRNDLLAWGPENMALHAVNAELTGTPGPAPLPVQLSADRPAYRSALFFILGIARIPVGVKALLQHRQDTNDLHLMEQLIAKHLAAMAVDFEAVSVHPPCPVTSSCFLSNPAYLEQLAANCQVAKEELGAVSAQVKFPMMGYVEITARTAFGTELSLVPPEPCCEPPAAVLGVLESVLHRAGLEVSRAVMTQTFAPTRLQ